MALLNKFNHFCAAFIKTAKAKREKNPSIFVCGYVVFAPCRRIGIAILDEHKADELTGS
jgi:hypothetical protein